MKRILTLLLFFLVVSVGAADRPNVVLFLMDDMGYGDCRAYNPESKVAMPNLEKLAAGGMRFTDAHSASAVCAPTRYSILTGNYPWRGRLENGTWLFHMPSQVLPGQKTVGELMQVAGYETAFLGKVHLGGTVLSKETGKPKRSLKDGFTDFDFSKPIQDTPASFGFDYAYELPQGIQGPPYVAFENGMLLGDPAELKIWEKGVSGESVIEQTGFGSPDWDSSQAGPTLTEKTLTFLENRDSEKPFFLYYSSQSCHVPHTPPVELGGVAIKGTTPDSHLDMLHEADVTLGKIIAQLEADGELDNTLILFTSDNGGLSRNRLSEAGPLHGHDSCAGLRGSKAQIFEGGHRVPLIAKWPSVIGAGSTSDAIVGLQDIYATLAELTGQPLAEDQGLDSESFLPVLKSEQDAPARSTLLVQANNEDRPGQRLMKMVREGDWKLITSKDLEPTHLFNLKTDLSETQNLLEAPGQKERVARMLSELQRIMNSERSTPAVSPGSETFSVEELFTPRTTLALKMKTSGEGEGKVERIDGKWHLTGEAPMRVEFVPAENGKWDISGFRLLGIPVLNHDKGITTIDGRLNNGDLTGWSHHAVGFSVAPSGEETTLGFPFPVVMDRYEGPEVFSHQHSKPNGHRSHWRQFFPDDVRSIVVELRSSTGRVDLMMEDPFLAWPATEAIDQALSAMPYLDEMGQVRAVEWPGKAHDIAEVRAELNREFLEAAGQAKSRKLSRFGGWIEGPKLEATGHFRTEKIDGKWWLVDPDGYLFFSVGACLAGHENETPINQKRLDANFFAWLPGEDDLDPNDYLRWVGRKKQGDREFIHFPPMNLQRAFGEDWNNFNRNGIHNRMRAWGVNTLGAWSDKALQQDGRTPYTLVASIWWQKGYGTFPSPFREDFEEDLREALQSYAWAKDDPWCLGVFLGNELEWPRDFTKKAFELGDGEESTRQWILKKLGEKYPTVKELNVAWETEFSDWNKVLTGKPDPIPKAARDDIEPLFLEFASTFFAKCKNAMNEVLPDVLYLGCRVHQAPNVLGRAAAGHVDVFSVNVYDSEVRTWHIPDDVDIPILGGEFHFGAADRGAPSPGLSASWDQRQRGLSFAHHLASALAEPRFVGVHWFQWIDQSAAGRWDGENHQCGFVDVTGRAHREFVETVSQATRHLYPARKSGDLSTEQLLERLLDD